MKRKVKKVYLVLYCLGMVVFVAWLVFSSSWIAGAVNGKSIREVSFADIKDKYMKDYVFCYIDNNIYEGGMLERWTIEGWALCYTTENTSDRYSSVILSGNEHSYELMPFSEARLDIPVAIPKNLNQPDMKISGSTGFVRQFSLLGIKNGVYDMYLCCWENETNHGMSDTFYQIIKNDSDVEIVPWSTNALKETVSAIREEGTRGHLDEVSVNDGLVRMRGWEFVPEMDSKEQSVYVELTDLRGNVIQYPAKMMTRSDVAKSYDDQRYAQSGYMTCFPEEEIQNGQYFVRILLESSGDIWCSKTYSIYRNEDKITIWQYAPSIVEPLTEPVEENQKVISRGYLDSVVEKDGLVEFYGWEHAPERESANQIVYIELTKPDGQTIYYPTTPVTRQDVAEGEGGQMYAQCGYMTTFLNDNFGNGEYIVYVLVENGEEVWRSKQYTVVKDNNAITVYQH